MKLERFFFSKSRSRDRKNFFSILGSGFATLIKKRVFQAKKHYPSCGKFELGFPCVVKLGKEFLNKNVVVYWPAQLAWHSFLLSVGRDADAAAFEHILTRSTIN
jgi:hypothetical protein